MLATGRADDFKEQELLPDFLTDIFRGVLGYSRAVDTKDRYTLSARSTFRLTESMRMPSSARFRPGHERFVVAVEGKGAERPAGSALCRVERCPQWTRDTATPSTFRVTG